MKVIELKDDWSLDKLTLAERPMPEPKPGEAVVKLTAASLNYRDWLLVQGGYGRAAGALPLVPLSDGAGVVEAVGEGVTRVAPGDRVCPIMFQGWLAGELRESDYERVLGGPLDGVAAEAMLLDAEGLVRLPPGLSDQEAACLPCAGLTAWNAVIGQGQVKPGERVLVLGTGGVALFALQFAKLAGAEVIVTSKSDEKLARARALGADHTINYVATPDWGKAARELGDGGVDLVVETGGGTLSESLRALRPGGRIALMGVLGGQSLDAKLSAIVMRRLSILGVTVGSRDDFEAMLRAIAASGLKPVIDSSYPLEELRPALEHLASQTHFGKVCVTI